MSCFGVYITSGTICTTTTRITRPLLLTPSSVDCVPTYLHSVPFFGRIYHYIPRNYHYCDLLWDSNPATVTRSVDPGQLPVTQVRWIAHRRSSDRAQWATPFRGLDWNQLHGIPESPASFSAWVGEKLPRNYETIKKSISWDMPGVRGVFRLLDLSTSTCHCRSWLLLVLASFELSLISRFQSCYAHICLLSILIQNYPDIS